MAQPVKQQPKWPLWILGATLLGLLALAGVYWFNPELYPVQLENGSFP